MLGMKNHFDISDSIEIREVDIAGVACICYCNMFIILNKYCLTQNSIVICSHIISKYRLRSEPKY